MNLFDLFVKISVDTGDFDSGVDRVSKACKSLGGDMKTTGKDSETLRNKINSLGEQYESASKEVDDLTKQFNRSVQETGETSKETQELAAKLAEAEKEAGSLKKEMDRLGKSLGDTGDDAEKAKKKADGFGSAWKKALTKLKPAAAAAVKGLAAVTAAAAAAFGAVVKQSVEDYSDYEQLVGGVETLFKNSSDKVVSYANNAYKTAGMSANEYMETVTSFSASLLQGLGGDTEAAAVIADQAITDMSDNANKMGTDMEMIQNAYQGFAKQNYTMLDNLKLGYGGTAGEMARLINDSGVLGDTMKVTEQTVNEVSFDKMIEAIHVVQTNMGITGTTAKEASKTIQGSVSAMRAAWKNFTTGMADDTQDVDTLVDNVVDSVDTVADNIIPRIQKLLPRLTQGLSDLTQRLSSKIPGLLSKVLPSFIRSTIKMVQNIAGTLTKSIPVIIDAASDLFSGIVRAIPGVAKEVLKNMPKIIKAVVDGLWNGVKSIVETVQDIFGATNEAVYEAKSSLEEAAASVTSFADAIGAAQPNIADLNTLLSATGKTVSDLDSQIETEANAINRIFAAALEEGRALRQTELDEIAQHYDKLRELEAEKLGIAQQQQAALVQAIQLEKNQITQEGMAQYISNIQAAYDQATELEKTNYLNELALIQNQYQVEGSLTEQEYQKRLEEAKAHHDAMQAQNDQYQQEALAALSDNAAATISSEQSTYEELQGIVSQYYAERNSAVGKSQAELTTLYQSGQAVANEYALAAAGLTEGQLEAGNATLTTLAMLVEGGGQLSDSAKTSVESMLAAFDGLPDEMEGTGKDALLGLTAGLDDTIPGLEDTSEMSAQSIVDAIKSYLGIASPSKVLRQMGQYAGEGLVNGLRGSQSSVRVAASILSATVTTTLNLKERLYQLGANAGQAFADGLSSAKWRVQTSAAQLESSAGKKSAVGGVKYFSWETTRSDTSRGGYDALNAKLARVLNRLDAYLPKIAENQLVLVTGASQVSGRALDELYGTTLRRKARGN
nr:MAG TPA: tail tape measure protein [Caudoviricetes sp.]